MLLKIGHLRKHVRLVSLVGKPTAGKGVKSKALAAMGGEFGISQITTSEMIRWNIQNGTELGAEFEKHRTGMNSRKLVPCELILPGLADAIDRAHKQGAQTIIIDGSPRSEMQAKALVNCRLDFELFELDISDEEAVRRTARRSEYEPREDDSKILEGLKTFKFETVPGIRFTKKAGCYNRIDGTQPMRSQLAQILRKLNFRPHQFKKMMSRLDEVDHAARIILDEVEGRRKRQEKPAFQQAPFWRGMPVPQTATASAPA